MPGFVPRHRFVDSVMEAAETPPEQPDLDGLLTEQNPSEMPVNTALQPPHVLAPPSESREPERWDHSNTPHDYGIQASDADHAENLTNKTPRQEHASAVTHAHPEASHRDSFRSDLPEPLWSETIDTGVDTEPSYDLGLPGITEEAPPTIRGSRETSLDAVFDQEPLPGLNRSPVTLPPPTWTDGPDEQAPKPAASPPVHSSPIPPRSASSEGVSAESGGLDVRTFLYGKRVGQDILDNQRNLIAKAGDTITPELVAQVETAGQLPDLIVHMVF